MKTLMLILMLAIATNSWANEDAQKWTTLDTGLQLTYTVAHVMDWTQTLHIARNPNKYYEKNADAYIGKHPTKKKVNAYFAPTFLIDTVISYSLPKPYRTIWQSFRIGMIYSTVQANRHIGIGISLRFN